MQLDGKRIAILLEDGYEDLEFWYPYYRLQEAGAEVEVLGAGDSRYTGKHGYEVSADRQVDAADPKAYDALVIPGGKAPEKMIKHAPLLDFVRRFDAEDRLIACICHGPMVLAAAGLLKGRKLTSYPGLQRELEQAGAQWVDEEVVHDGNVITSRRPEDLPAFCRDIIGAFVDIGESSVPQHERIRYY